MDNSFLGLGQGPVHTKSLTESMTKICSDEAEIMLLSRSKHIISNKV